MAGWLADEMRVEIEIFNKLLLYYYHVYQLGTGGCTQEAESV